MQEARPGCLGPNSPLPKRRECLWCRRFLYWSVAKAAPKDDALCDECLRNLIADYWLPISDESRSA